MARPGARWMPGGWTSFLQQCENGEHHLKSWLHAVISSIRYLVLLKAPAGWIAAGMLSCWGREDTGYARTVAAK